MIDLLLINRIQDHWQIFQVPFVLHRLVEIFRIKSHLPRFAVFPICWIPSSLGPVDDPYDFRI